MEHPSGIGVEPESACLDIPEKGLFSVLEVHTAAIDPRGEQGLRNNSLLGWCRRLIPEEQIALTPVVEEPHLVFIIDTVTLDAQQCLAIGANAIWHALFVLRIELDVDGVTPPSIAAIDVMAIEEAFAPDLQGIADRVDGRDGGVADTAEAGEVPFA